MIRKLLIAEESLKNTEGHFFDYVHTIREEAIKQGWQVDIAANINVIESVRKMVNALPVFRRGRFVDQTKRTIGERYFGLILHNWSTLRDLWRLLNLHASEVVFVPTALAHQLLAWWVIMKFHRNKPKKLVLLFLNTPAVWDSKRQTTVLPRRAKITGLLLRLFKNGKSHRRVLLAVQTQAAKREMRELTGRSFELFPQPVNCFKLMPPKMDSGVVTFGFFGFTRYEKGADIFVKALQKILERNPELKIKFIVQWTSSFSMPDGSIFNLSDELKSHPKVTLINHTIYPEEYYELLSVTDCLVLPYRNSSYYSRDSRIAIEAVTSGRPVIFTKGGWLAETVGEYGTGIGIEDESVDELADGILALYLKIGYYQQEALRKLGHARGYFSPDFFMKTLSGAIKA